MYRSAAAEPGTTEDHGAPGGRSRATSGTPAPRPGPETSRPVPGVARDVIGPGDGPCRDWPFPSGRDQGRLERLYRSMSCGTLTPTEKKGAMNSRGTGMCPHTPPCPAPSAPDREAAHTIVNQTEQGWSLLCNGVVIFEDTGELLPGGAFIAPHRPTDLAAFYRPAGVAPGHGGRAQRPYPSSATSRGVTRDA